MAEHSKLTLAAGLVGLLAIVMGFRGCSGYGKVGSRAYEHAKALYSICNRQDVERLELFSTSLDEAHVAGEVTGKEHRWLKDIMAQAQAGNWEKAAANARRLMKDQVTRGP